MKADIEKMRSFDLYEEYDHLGFRWVNEKLTCGCILAACVNILPTNDDIKFYVKKNTELNNIKATLKIITMPESGSYQKFLEMASKIAIEMSIFIKNKKEEHGFPDQIDFNGENYYVKIYKSSTCHAT